MLLGDINTAIYGPPQASPSACLVTPPNPGVGHRLRSLSHSRISVEPGDSGTCSTQVAPDQPLPRKRSSLVQVRTQPLVEVGSCG